MRILTCKDIKEQVEGIYYSCKEEGMFWEPFEYHTQEQVDEYIDNDVQYWCGFLDIKYEN
jgi:hypothetical protein